MGYENAKSTKIIAVNCCACNRPLRDALSVELGIGPVCRNKYLPENGLTETEYREANVLVHELAALGLAPKKIERLRVLGFETLADRLEERLGVAVRIVADGDDLVVETPYRAEAVATWRRIPGRRWDSDKKANRVPARSARALLSLLREHFAGLTATGRKGLFVIA